MFIHIVEFVEYFVDRKLFGYKRVKLIVTCWKAFIAKFHNLFLSLTLTVYMCLFVCMNVILFTHFDICLQAFPVFGVRLMPIAIIVRHWKGG